MGAARGMLATVAVLAGLLAAAGCGGSAETVGEAPSDGAAQAENTTSKRAGEPAERGEVELVTVDRAGFLEAVARRRGRPVVVDFWATWCLPCLEHFPHTVKLYHHYGPERAAFVSVSFDEEESAAAALDFLRQQGATFDNLRSDRGASEEVFAAYGIEGGLPHYRLYDRQGRPAGEYKAGELGSLEAKLRELLASPGR